VLRADKQKAAGVNSDLWVGIVLLLLLLLLLVVVVVCGLSWLWATTRPLIDELEAEASELEAVREAEQPALARR
jgi:hypothetical protein